ncbi:hypothetical protein A2630_04010 [Candidatus Woesebacteria bacterium RIFCSPHIGHO2_01_FULL_44_10]|uniref:Uncharacterized protein n=1 Tax=Candidatus Woesebacteria bacterium RIFCSPLOWO2_01_FULL_44_14 TaxID=1802525 RepID=A0A1F8C274_9BACT|nr:MAG: hypothetical protein A2630_04010 [Candidatus Woesebacteria bacterium RIFCSPHIGHO2_01_FULL_44_10]OGM54519.1 MAG: hypothetical protein A3F62_03210 [Candidatus Woesebacteria bacterium RIFCSPHIGHO2_12_FULL_44_11]OGM70413.1 MAG: hypothetical protein A2975_01770 [Candidatus Woesebacteria bacterium RIFCSPLOWO2_01_FULL_44_14]
MDETAKIKTLNQASSVKRDLEAAADNLYRLNLSQEDTDTKKRQYEEAVEKIENLKVIKLALAFDPSTDFVDKMWQIVAQKMGEGIVLDIALDKSLIGGVVIEHDGQHQDYSLRRIFNAKTKL